LAENGSPISQYKIELKTKVGTYVEIKEFCDGTDANILANNYCLFSMASFMQSPLNLVRGDLIVARITVKNAIGWTKEYSPDNTAGVLVQIRPSKPHAMTVDLPSTNTYQTIVFMQPLVSASETGGSPIVSYSLEWDNGSNGAGYVVLNGVEENNIQLRYVMSDLTAGMTYRFKYRVRNIFGWSSEYSDALTILAATRPDRPAMVQTANVGTSVRI
jgi:hypothetical protein